MSIAKPTGHTSVMAFDGREVKCLGYSRLDMVVGGEKVVQNARVAEQLVGGLDVVIGMDVIDKLGGVTVVEETVKFGKTEVCAVTALQRGAPDVLDKDFEAYFDGHVWTVRYFWNELGEPRLKNVVGEYSNKLDEEKTKCYEAEIERWIKEEILIPWNSKGDGLLPLMAIEQQTKNKIRPVLDFRELNNHVKCHTGDDGVAMLMMVP